MAVPNAAMDPEVLKFSTTVSRGGREIELDETFFYPESGGQPADRGTIAGFTVLDITVEGDRIVHTIDGELEQGEHVDAQIDPHFRWYCMRAHTASHIVYGAGRKRFDSLGYGGFDISETKVRVDLATETDITDEDLVAVERLANQCVWDSREVTWEIQPASEMTADSTIAFNTKTEEGLAGESVRIVEIADWDKAACGGTHVSNTNEIGPITVTDRSNPGEGLTRIEFAVGTPGIDHRAAEKTALLDVRGQVGTAVADLPNAISRIIEDRDTAVDERNQLQVQILDYALNDILGDSFEHNGHEYAIGQLDIAAPIDTISTSVQSAIDDVSVLVVLTTDNRIVVGTDGSLSAQEIVTTLTDTFGGGGGGSKTMAQGGGLTADIETITAVLTGKD